ncbi:hypothetical protein ABVT39_019728 [Epinephelus coioides]
MGCRSEAKFGTIDDPEIIDLHRDFQLLCYSCLDTEVTRQELYQMCVGTADRALNMLAHLLQETRAFQEENAMLRQKLSKLKAQESELRRKLHDTRQQTNTVTNDVTDEDMLTIDEPTEPTETEMHPLVLSNDEQDPPKEALQSKSSS